MMTIRELHLFVGVFIAPSVLFFAFTGGLQLFRLQEAQPGYRPPAIIQKLGEVHIDQRFALKRARPAPAPGARAAAEKTPQPKPVPPVKETLLKGLFLAVAVGLFVSTLLGLWMGLTHSRHRGLAWILLAAGAALPVLILAL